MVADDRLWDDATAALLAAWPKLAEPMVAALAGGAVTVPADVIDRLAAQLAAPMLQVAKASARLASHEAAQQAVANPAGEPNRDRLERLAATFAEIIAAGYAAAAAETALTAPIAEASRLRAAAGTVRKALEALGTALTALVPTHVGAAMAAAEHEGRRAVAEAHPPLYLVADEHDDLHACGPCRDVTGKRYDTLDAAIEDYPTVGYRHCLGGIRCRGRLRSVWREPLTEAAQFDPPLTRRGADRVSEQTGAMIALVPTAADAQRIAVAGGVPAMELHCTLAYLGDAARLDAAARQALISSVASGASGLPQVNASVFSLAVFNPGSDNACLTLGLTGEVLDAVHHFLWETVDLPASDQHAPWQPHLTVFDGDGLRRLETLRDRVGPVQFDRLRIAVAGETFDVPLLPDTFDPADGYGEWLAEQGLAEAVDAHPGDGRLKAYWLGKGAAKWATSPHPWTTLYRHLRKYINNPALLKSTVSRWYIDFFHHTPNQHKVAESAAVGPLLLVESGQLLAI